MFLRSLVLALPLSCSLRLNSQWYQYAWAQSNCPLYLFHVYLIGPATDEKKNIDICDVVETNVFLFHIGIHAGYHNFI